MSYSETWGTPYDPHSYVSSWASEDDTNHNALVNLEAPASRPELLGLIEDVLEEEDQLSRRAKWAKVHDYYHQQAALLPLWGRRIVAIVNTRLSGYQAGHQQFDFPVHRLVPVEGSNKVTISPGAQTGRFESVGHMNPHTYRPNEFFSNNWVYEGLVSYGEEGQILPSLAQSWTVKDTADGGSKCTFQLRPNVSFHDGSSWNCQAAKMNIDHVFAGELKEPVWHGWYGVPKYLKNWKCASDMELIMTTSTKFYPFLQELTFIRPLRFLSPNAFSKGNSSDLYTANSCDVGWGTIESDDGTKVTCTGISNITGTGPFAFVSRKENEMSEGNTVDDEVIFKRNENYWGGVPAIEELKVVRYEKPEEIKAALLNGALDIMWGDGILPATDITEIVTRTMDGSNSDLSVFIGEDIQNVVLVLNTGTSPLDDINTRKAVIHAINKKRLIEKELGGILDPVDNVFPRSMPYCDVDLTPHWDYDIEKAILLSCNQDENFAVSSSSSNANQNIAIGVVVGLAFLCLALFLVAVIYVRKSKALRAELKRSEGAIQA